MEDAAQVMIGSVRTVQTVDFITPLVPDPADFGRIAAANAMSDAFVAGAWPISALAIACVPLGSLDEFSIALRSGRDHLAAERCQLVGGHSIADSEPKLGFAVIGTVNSTGRLLSTGALDGDAIILTKPLGVGVLTSAYKAGIVDENVLRTAIEAMSRPNSCVPRLLESSMGDAVHAATDVTGFGLLGHASEFARRNSLGAVLDLSSVPLLPGARDLAEAGICTSAFRSNVAYVEDQTDLQLKDLAMADQVMLVDAQTSGGALLAVEKDAIKAVCALLREWGDQAWAIGWLTAEERISVF